MWLLAAWSTILEAPSWQGFFELQKHSAPVTVHGVICFHFSDNILFFRTTKNHMHRRQISKKCCKIPNPEIGRRFFPPPKQAVRLAWFLPVFCMPSNHFSADWGEIIKVQKWCINSFFFWFLTRWAFHVPALPFNQKEFHHAIHHTALQDARPSLKSTSPLFHNPPSVSSSPYYTIPYLK